MPSPTNASPLSHNRVSWRSHGNEHWEFDERGLMRRRDATINDYRIDEGDRRLHPRGPAS
jgi:nuclear transport factor 2 (NTF2) superfamily protein